MRRSARDTTMQITEDAPLDRLNTFGVPARTRWLARIEALGELPALFADPRLADLPVLVLGDGSNVLMTRDWPGLVLTIAADAVSSTRAADGSHRVRAEAGLGWHALVEWTLARGIIGLENLVAIPGRVGAAPIQNIGAYGVELDEFVESVEAWDRRGGGFVAIPREACGFAYRDSRFKSEADRDRFIVTALNLHIPPGRSLRLDYPGVREALDALGIETPTAADVARAIAAIRRRKLPDPREIGNAGSFFKNPVVPSAQADALRARHPALPSWPAGPGRTKLSAAWLIESAGMKGFRDGEAGVSERHALVLVNHGRATGADLWRVAGRVADAVRARFGIDLEPEPRIV
jgi:UDP-N-acetylmuramate dehydrogenase